MKIDQVEQLQQESAADMAPLLAGLSRSDLTDTTLDGYGALLRRVNLHDEVAPPQRPALLEGAQGGLLDEHHGFWAHVTPSTTTFAWADDAPRCRPAGG